MPDILITIEKILRIDDEPDVVRLIHYARENDGRPAATGIDGAEGLSPASQRRGSQVSPPGVGPGCLRAGAGCAAREQLPRTARGTVMKSTPLRSPLQTRDCAFVAATSTDTFWSGSGALSPPSTDWPLTPGMSSRDNQVGPVGQAGADFDPERTWRSASATHRTPQPR